MSDQLTKAAQALRLVEEARIIAPFRPSPAAYAKLVQAAEFYRAAGLHFEAGIAMSSAVDAALGDMESMKRAYQAALTDWRHVLDTVPEYDPLALAASHKICRDLYRSTWLLDEPRKEILAQIAVQEIRRARCMVLHYANQPNWQEYLLRGVQFAADLLGGVVISCPPYEVPSEVEGPGTPYLINLASAFKLFARNQQWKEADELARREPNGLISASLRGWAAVAAAEVDPNKAAEYFDQASLAFASDTAPEPSQLESRGGHWSSANLVLWAGYFRARACLVRGFKNHADMLPELLAAKEALEGTNQGWVNADAVRLRIIVRSLANLAAEPDNFNPASALDDYDLATRMTGLQEGDDSAKKFLLKAGEAFRGLAAQEPIDVTGAALHEALDALSKVPVIGPTSSILRVVRDGANKVLFGPLRTSAHRDLENLKKEADLRHVLLRILQSGTPYYAQIRHGPFEYGKDLGALVEVDAHPILRLYQVKLGDINKTNWPESREQLEQMLLVPIPALHLPVKPESIEAFLVTNGHASPHVEPIIDAWIERQKNEHGYHIEFLHLDRLIDWIVKGRLLTELKTALAEVQKPARRKSKSRAKSADRGGSARHRKTRAPRKKK
jgi:hypothetical protein